MKCPRRAPSVCRPDQRLTSPRPTSKQARGRPSNHRLATVRHATARPHAPVAALSTSTTAAEYRCTSRGHGPACPQPQGHKNKSNRSGPRRRRPGSREPRRRDGSIDRRHPVDARARPAGCWGMPPLDRSVGRSTDWSIRMGAGGHHASRSTRRVAPAGGVTAVVPLGRPFARPRARPRKPNRRPIMTARVRNWDAPARRARVRGPCTLAKTAWGLYESSFARPEFAPPLNSNKSRARCYLPPKASKLACGAWAVEAARDKQNEPPAHFFHFHFGAKLRRQRRRPTWRS